jgi:acyl transferase domain-containing protein/acyl carrier protein
MSNLELQDALDSIAIVGMSGRFPGAKNVEEFWRNLREGVEAVTFFSEEELEREFVDPSELRDPNYVKVRAILDDVEMFDAPFFGFSPREAAITDPQHRLFMECCWEALEDAGYDPQKYPGTIGIYGGAGANTYLLFNLASAGLLTGSASTFQSFIYNKNDHLTSRVAYKLNLRGQSMTVQTACSTSLVAVSLACQNLLNYQIDMALAGGVSVIVPQKTGYLFHDRGIASPDGHCRAFDAKAQGTVSGNGVGIVILKRLQDALADGDTIRAVIRGSAINNDGALKAGYTAPSIDSQAEVIAMALGLAGVDAETISYIEAHGTGTPLGDPIEIAALTRAFRRQTNKNGFCAVGSVKTGIGHLDTAAGVAGLMKTVLMLQNRMVAPSLNFDEPNPEIDFANSPFYVNTKLHYWQTDSTPRRAGVSSFGIGGTNAHVVLEEAPERAPSGPSRAWQLLLLSAKTAPALETAGLNLVSFLKEHRSLNLADIAHTLRVGRKDFEHRRMLVCRDVDEAIVNLETLDPERVFTRVQESVNRPLSFMFPGQGAQYVGMGSELYESEPLFRQEVDRCAELLESHLGFDLREVLYPAESQAEEAAERLRQTSVTQPALFVIEYAMARLLMSWGINPQSMIGHSLGEYVAACLAGVFTLPDALALIAARARLIQSLPGGSMLAVPLPESRVQEWLGENLSLAVVNGHAQCVVSGSTEAIAQLEQSLIGQGLICQRLDTSHAFHSAMMDPILPAFLEEVRKVRLAPPQLPFISNVTGTWITETEATDPSYWVSHLRQCVRFADGLEPLLEEPDAVLLEVGPGRTLRSIARWHPHKKPRQVMLSSLPHPRERHSDIAFLLNTLGHLWLAGIVIDWSAFSAQEQRHRLPLPTYPFERQRYWIEPKPSARMLGPQQPSLEREPDIADWFYVPVWKETASPVLAEDGHSGAQQKTWLVFMDECGLASRFAEQLRGKGHKVIGVRPGTAFRTESAEMLQVNPQRAEDYDALIGELRAQNLSPQMIAHFWSVTPHRAQQLESESLQSALDRGFLSLLFMAQALGRQQVTEPLQVILMSNNVRSVAEGDLLSPEKSTVLGPCLVMPKEYPNIVCRSIDISLPRAGSWQEQLLTEQLVAEVISGRAEPIVAYRGNRRWVQTFDAVKLHELAEESSVLQPGDVCLMTGGLGGLGLELADYLACKLQLKLVLVGRSGLPEREEWARWLETHTGDDRTSYQIRRLQEMEADGADVSVYRADVTDERQMREVLTRVREKFGRIDGVVHAAGIAGGGMMQIKSPETVAEVIAPKVKGARVLESLLEGDSLKFFALFSSMSAVVGRLGQVDYTAANIFLDTFAHYYHARTGALTVSINWGAWENLGMAADTDSSAPAASDGKIVKHLDHPLLDSCTVEPSGKEIYRTNFNVDRHWVLDEHRIIGNPIIPGVAFFEMVRAAIAERARGQMLEFNDVFFITPVRVKHGETRELQLVLEDDKDLLSFAVRGHVGENNGDATLREFAIGKVRLSDPEPPVKYDIAALRERCNLQEILLPEEDREESLGPRWQSVQRVHLGRNEILILLEIPEVFASDFEHLKFHPALLDRAAGITKRFLADEGSYLPFSYKKLKMKRDLPRRIYSYARFKEEESPSRETINFDIVLMDEQGFSLVEVEGFSQKQINDLADEIRALAQTPKANGNGNLSEAAHAVETPVSNAPAEDVSARRQGKGIQPEEGAEAFGRLLSGRIMPQVIVSVHHPQAAIEQADSVAQQRILESTQSTRQAKQAYALVNTGNPYVAPESEVERKIAAIWQETLGVERVGVHDNFFDLGGNSLFAIQVISKLQRELSVEISPAMIFEGASLRAFAKLVSQDEQEPPDYEQRQSRGERRKSKVQERRKTRAPQTPEVAE